MLHWTRPLTHATLDWLGTQPPADVWIEAFGCDISPEFIANYRRGYWTYAQNSAENTFFDSVDASGTASSLLTTRPAQDAAPSEHTPDWPVWINLEYLSAERYVKRQHGLASPVMSGPARGAVKHFFYPGFTPGTGGLLRGAGAASAGEPSGRLHEAYATTPDTQAPKRRISLFCYEPPALVEWLRDLQAGGHRTELLIATGRATHAAQAAQAALEAQKQPIFAEIGHMSSTPGVSLLSFSYLPWLSQPTFDTLLASCDFNCVRGEDSLVQALLAGKPFVWHIYPQDDGAHADKLNAFLDWLDAPADWRAFHRIWNGLQTGPLPPIDWQGWSAVALGARSRLLAQDDLLTQLLAFVGAKARPRQP